MPTVIFLPSGIRSEVDDNTKILLAAKKAKVDIRFGCAACRCGTCGILLKDGRANLSEMKENERELLERINLTTDGTVRLACQARILKDTATVDLDFQNTYSPE
ncbi:MAG: 2Fe-2S iron-sulfur cluster-binding protein [Oligoflexales bacterium]